MAETPVLRVEGLRGGVEGVEILKGVDLQILPGEIHALMGPNGSGKSTLANILAGNPAFEVTAGKIEFRGEEVTHLPADERARRGIFLAFQYPEEISGVTLVQFIRAAMSQRRGVNMAAFEARLMMGEQLSELGMDPAFADRYVNEGFSGGEKKRAEVLQMTLLEPDLAILDETDSGLDIDALKVVSAGVNRLREQRPQLGALVITHYQRILDTLEPDIVHVFVDGKIVETGGGELANRLEREGYEAFRSTAGV